ncbi:MAG TPA: GNAT family N-acetyltransferase [Actinomycetota bacterium]|jgi:GNAT superfamily N-acetyltransferase
MEGVRQVRAGELVALSSLVGREFANDVMVSWTVPDGDDLERASEAFFTTLHQAYFSHRWLWVVGDPRIDGMAMWVPPDPDDTYGAVMLEIDAEIGGIMSDRKPRYDRFWAWIDDHRPAEPHWYLEHIVVRPERRGGGLGRALIQHGLTGADRDGASAWLVTSKAGNVPLYERFGFVVEIAEHAPDGGPYLWFMTRDPLPPSV